MLQKRCGFIRLYLLKVRVSEAKAHIPGLGRIQLERNHKAGTGTKLLAVLVRLSKKEKKKRTTNSCAK